MRRVLFGPVVVLVAGLILAAMPVGSAQSGDLVVVGEHTILVQKSARDGATSVTETVLFANQGASDFEGVLTLDLDPDATISAFFFIDGTRSPLPNGGAASRDPVPNATVGSHTRYSFDLAAMDVVFPANATSGMQIVYTLPADDLAFTRGFTDETPLLTMAIGQVAGLRPSSSTHELQPVGTSWSFRLAPGDTGPLQPGDFLAFEWIDEPVAMRPLGVSIQGNLGDTLRLAASPVGGIQPYTVTWDLDNDGTCDDGSDTSASMDVSTAGRHTATVCVRDSAVPPNDVTQRYEVTTLEAQPTSTSPTAWVLGAVGLLVGALLMYGLVQGGLLGGARSTSSSGSRAASPSMGAESRDMLELRQRVMVASLKELEIAKKKGEVAEGLYTPLKAELKQDTVRVMRELEKRKSETV